MSEATLLKPGFLVSLKTTIGGGIRYDRNDLEDYVEDDGTEVARWETTRTIEDAAEHKLAVSVRSKCHRLIYNVCSPTSFGLLCPTSKQDELDEAAEQARKVAAEFNAKSKHSNVEVYILKGRIAETDEEATRAIAYSIREMLDEMEKGVRDLDAEAIRKVARKAVKVGRMVETTQSSRVSAAVKEARDNARQITRRIEKKGEDAAKVAVDLKLKAIRNARFSFLDLGEELEVGEVPTVSAQRFANISDESDELTEDGITQEEENERIANSRAAQEAEGEE